jgi:exopolyphosphatase/guanosine-5'-triphosphate,3'-diphosphate pyrophosphatase
MSPRRSAFIDVGTNTVLCLIADVRDTGRFRVLDDLAEIARLGQGVDQTGMISPAGEERAMAILARYRERCDDLGVEEITAVGTSALRDAKNSDQVRAHIRDALGIDIRVISGAEEAEYSFLAVRRGLSHLTDELVVIDIGGGSTEFILGNKNGVSRALSIDVGSVRLTERYLHSDPVQAGEVIAIGADVAAHLAVIKSEFIAQASSPTLVGIAGTFTTLAAIEKKLARYSASQVHGSVLNLPEVERQVAMLQSRTIAERKQIAGLEPKRADVIFAGAYLIEKIMGLFGASQVVVSDQGVRYGLLHEAANRSKFC